MPVEVDPLIPQTDVEAPDPLTENSLNTFVITFNGRSGAVSPLAGDYAGSKITNDSTVSGATVTGALEYLDANKIGPGATLTPNYVLKSNGSGKLVDSTMLDDGATVTIPNVTIQGGVITGITDLAIADGGTGASTASGARTNLGLAIGSDVQAWDAGLTSIAGLTTGSNKMIYTQANDVYAVTDLTSFARTLLADASATTARATLDAVGGRSALTQNAILKADAFGDAVDSSISDDGSTVTIGGNLTVNGTTTLVDSTTVAIGDSMMKYAKDNTTTDVVDIGWYGAYGPTPAYAGMFRDASDGKFKIYSGLQAEPGNTVNIGGTGYAAGTLVVGPLEATSVTATNATADYFAFNTSPGAIPGAEGIISWNTTEKTVDIDTGLGPVIQVGHESVTFVYNGTGSLIPNGSAVNGVAVFGGYTSVELADASVFNGVSNVLITTMDIPSGTYGLATSFGLVRDIDTTAIGGAGPLVYVSATTPGALTRTRPEFPNYRILVGGINTEGVSGVISVNLRERSKDTLDNVFDGSFRETIDFMVDSDGATITGTLADSDALGTLTAIFSDGFTEIDVSTPLSVTLTAGTDNIPQTNYIYVPKSTKTLTASTSDWPIDEEHIRVAQVLLRSASTTKLDGALRNQNWNDHIKTTADNGHLLHIAEAIRVKNDATWWSGTEATGHVEAAGTEVYISCTAGTVYQLHRQAFPLFDMRPYTIDIVSQGSKTFTISDDGDLSSTFPDGRKIKIYGSTGNDGLYTVQSTSYSAPNFVITVEESIPSAVADGEIGDDIHVYNDSVSPYGTIADLTDITLDASGASLNNTSFSLVIWGVANKTGQESHLMVNLPTNTYSKTSPASAVSDALNYSVYEIPQVLKGTGFLIARMTFVNNGGVWSLYDTEDLRGRVPNSTAGGGAGGTGVTTFLALTDTPSAYVGGTVVKVNSGATALEFVADDYVIGNSNLSTTNAITTVSASGTITQQDTTLSSGVFTRAGEIRLSATGANIVTAYTNGSEAMRINSTGQVLINATLPVGTEKLYVNGPSYIDGRIDIEAVSASTNGSSILSFVNPNTAGHDCGIDVWTASSGILGCNMLFGTNLVFNSSAVPTRLVAGEESCGMAFQRTGYIQFLTGGTGADATEAVRINSTGQVLIGTTTSGASKLVVNDDSIQINTSKTPASASATGTTGQVAWDSSYIYVCTATDTWKRAAIATW